MSLVSNLYNDDSGDEEVIIELVPLSQYLGLKKCPENVENPHEFSLQIFPNQEFGWDMRKLSELIANEDVRVHHVTSTIIYVTILPSLIFFWPFPLHGGLKNSILERGMYFSTNLS